MRRIELIKDWRHAWRLFSVQVAALLVCVDAAGEYLPFVREWIGEGYAKYLGMAVIVARLIRQAPAVVADDARTGAAGRTGAGVVVAGRGERGQVAEEPAADDRSREGRA